MGTAVEEMIPLCGAGRGVHATRTAQADLRSAACPSPRGNLFCCPYVSANRDGDVFTDPMRFDVRARPEQAPVIRLRRAFLPGGLAGRMEMNSFFSG